MTKYRALLREIVEMARNVLGDNLMGVYLHGSLAMGCFHPDKSDIDLLFVVKSAVADDAKRRFMDEIVAMNHRAPAKGIEMSVVRADTVKPFRYPTPFELHFSVTHLNWYRTDPADYIARMNGVDADLAAHCTIIRHRGMTLWGKPIAEVFGEVPAADYFDSIWGDVSGAEADILRDPVYVILNLCRVLAYKRERLILSKEEGGVWGMDNVPQEYAPLVAAALAEYRGGERMPPRVFAQAFAAHMLKEITGE